MKYWNRRLLESGEYTPGEQPDDPEEFIKLNTNESPFPPPGPVLEAIRKKCDANLRRYPNPTAEPLREAFAVKNRIGPENVFVANGSDEIFTLILRGFIDPDQRAAYPYPSYSLYYTLSEINGIPCDTVDLNMDFSYDLTRFLGGGYRLVIISNPNNPTGSYCEVGEIRKFLKKFDGLFVVDEAYIDFYGGSAGDLIKEFDNLIVTRSFSKSYSLAGLRVGLALAHEEIIRGFMKIKDSYNVDRLAMAGALASLEEPRGFKYNMDMIRNNKEYLEERLAGLGFVIVPSRANFIFTRHSRVPSDDLYAKLKERKILVRHFSGRITSDYVRISIGSMMEIKKLIAEIESILEGG